jgi:hypothetical protein
MKAEKTAALGLGVDENEAPLDIESRREKEGGLRSGIEDRLTIKPSYERLSAEGIDGLL